MISDSITCSDPTSLCETQTWLGVAGSCNFTTGACECPDGFSGKDDWRTFNDCHVNENLATIIHFTIFAVSSLAFLLSLGSLWYLGRKWGFALCHCLGGGSRDRRLRAYSNYSRTNSMLDSPVPTARLEKFLDVETPASHEKADADTEPGEVPLKNDANVVTSKTNRSSTSGAIGTPRHMSIRGPDTPLNDTPKPKVSMSQRSQRSFRSRLSIPRQSMMKAPVTGSGSVHKDEMARKSWNRQRNTLLVLYMYVSFGISNGVMYAMFFLGYNREDSIVPSIGLATATASVLCGLWGLASVWYYSLPNVELFGRLFAPKHLLVRRPNFVRYSSIGNVVAINIVSHSVLWILPLILGNQYRDTLDIIYLVTVAIAVLIFCVELYIICSLLTYCFHKLSKSAKQRARSRGSLMGTGIQASVLDDETEPPTPRTASVHQANFERQRIMFRSAKHTVHIIMWADKILGPLIFGLVMVAAILPGMRENMYLFFGGVVFLASMAAIVNIVVFLCRTTGPGYAKSDGASQGTRDPSHMDPL